MFRVSQSRFRLCGRPVDWIAHRVGTDVEAEPAVVLIRSVGAVEKGGGKNFWKNRKRVLTGCRCMRILWFLVGAVKLRVALIDLPARFFS